MRERKEGWLFFYLFSPMGPPYFGEVYDVFAISVNEHAQEKEKWLFFLSSPTTPRILVKFMRFLEFQRMNMHKRKENWLFFT